MTLFLIGLGLGSFRDITLRGMEILNKSDIIFYENYTSLLGFDITELEKNIKKKIIPITREELEESDILMKDSKKKNISLIVIGDPLSATTHIELIMRAKELGVESKVIHNASIITAISETGLQLYKFGRVISLPFITDNLPKSVYDNISANKKNGLHSLILLDIKAHESRFMTINQAIEILLKMEQFFLRKILGNNQKWIACARIGMDDQKIIYDHPKELLNINFGKQPHCIVIPGNLHFLEQEFLDKL